MPDYPLEIYRASRDGSTAVLRIRRHPFGPELQWMIDGKESFARVCRNPPELQAEVDAHRAEMERHGWRFEADASPRN